MSDNSVLARMRGDWNARAREDAHYYVAFGRRNQDTEGFFETGDEQARGLEMELPRLAPGPMESRRALEIGCGPGRLMRPLARHFAEIHGVDISEEMVAMARENLRSVPNACPHVAAESDLKAFEDESFDFIYSYAVFQHIPSRDVVMGYLRDAARVAKPRGIIRVQINGLPQSAKTYDTWSGVRIPAEDVRQFAREAGLQLLALDGTETQYMWATLRKPGGAPALTKTPLRVWRAVDAFAGEFLTPVSGRFASLSLLVEGLSEEADLNAMEATIDGKPCQLSYLGPSQRHGMHQLNLLLPAGLRTGLAPLSLRAHGSAAPVVFVRLGPPPPPMPAVKSVCDGVDMVGGHRITSGTVKATVEEVEDIGSLQVLLAGKPILHVDTFRTEPRLPRWEVNFPVPANLAPGGASVEIRLGKRRLGVFPIEVTARGK